MISLNPEILKDFIKSIKSNKVLLKNNRISWNPQNTRRFHEIHKISEDLIKFNSLYWYQQDFVMDFTVDFISWLTYEFHYRFHRNRIHCEIHNEIMLISVKSCEMLWISWNLVDFSKILVDVMKFVMKLIMNI